MSLPAQTFIRVTPRDGSFLRAKRAASWASRDRPGGSEQTSISAGESTSTQLQPQARLSPGIVSHLSKMSQK